MRTNYKIISQQIANEANFTNENKTNEFVKLTIF